MAPPDLASGPRWDHAQPSGAGHQETAARKVDLVYFLARALRHSPEPFIAGERASRGGGSARGRIRLEAKRDEHIVHFPDSRAIMPAIRKDDLVVSPLQHA